MTEATEATSFSEKLKFCCKIVCLINVGRVGTYFGKIRWLGRSDRLGAYFVGYVQLSPSTGAVDISGLSWQQQETGPLVVAGWVG